MTDRFHDSEVQRETDTPNQNGHQRSLDMKEFENIPTPKSPDEFLATSEGDRWISMLSEILGVQATYILTPSIDSDTQRETAVFHLEQGTNGNSNHKGSPSSILLTVSRNVVSPGSKFMVDLRLRTHKGKKNFYNSQISKIVFNLDGQSVGFVAESSNNGRTAPLVNLSRTGEIHPRLDASSIN